MAVSPVPRGYSAVVTMTKAKLARLMRRMLGLSPQYCYDRDLRAGAERNRRSRRALARALIAPGVTAAA
jgi:hypothetical protein